MDELTQRVSIERGQMTGLVLRLEEGVKREASGLEKRERELSERTKESEMYYVTAAERRKNFMKMSNGTKRSWRKELTKSG